MLAIQLVEIKWFKESRNPAGAEQRGIYLQPKEIAPESSLISPEGMGKPIFLQRCSYLQHSGKVTTAEENHTLSEQRLYKDGQHQPFTGSDEYAQRQAAKAKEHISKEKGSFYDLEKLQLPSLTIMEEPDNAYRIKWYDSGEGMPRRRGGNEDLYKKGSRLAGKPNTLNETAFVLQEGQAGVLKYNYRYSYYDGQWYKCYYVYVVNTDVLTRDIFLRSYDYEYNQLADLF